MTDAVLGQHVGFVELLNQPLGPDLADVRNVLDRVDVGRDELHLRQIVDFGEAIQVAEVRMDDMFRFIHGSQVTCHPLVPACGDRCIEPFRRR